MDHLWLPENVSTFGNEVDWLFYLILVITGVAFVGTQAVLIWFLVKYRARPGQKATYIHGSHAIELAWTIVPALILVLIALIQGSAWYNIKQGFPSDNEAVRIQVFAKQFEWRFGYPGTDGKFGTPDDVYTLAGFHVPVGKKILIEARSQDVLHSFFLPHFRQKQDIVPGMNVRIWFEGTKPGKWDLACAELCGLGHYRMQGSIEVHDQPSYDQWHAAQSKEAPAAFEAAKKDRERLERRLKEARESGDESELHQVTEALHKEDLRFWIWEWGQSPRLKVEKAPTKGH